MDRDGREWVAVAEGFPSGKMHEHVVCACCVLDLEFWVLSDDKCILLP
jgi:hypothetical protein